MKTWKLILIFISLTSTISCKKSNSTVTLSVESYIALLKANKYESFDLPAFTYKDIPALLKYRNETQIISNFPRNGISYYPLQNVIWECMYYGRLNRLEQYL